MLQSMGSQRVRHSLVTEQQLLQDQSSWGGSSLAVGRGEAPYLEGLRCGPLQRPTFHFPLVGGGGVVEGFQVSRPRTALLKPEHACDTSGGLIKMQVIWGKVKSLHSSQAPRRCRGSRIWGEQALPTPQSCLLPTEGTYEVPKPEFGGRERT